MAIERSCCDNSNAKRQRAQAAPMIFTRTPLEDAYLIAPERHGDDRGFFARVLCEREMGAMR